MADTMEAGDLLLSFQLRLQHREQLQLLQLQQQPLRLQQLLLLPQPQKQQLLLQLLPTTKSTATTSEANIILGSKKNKGTKSWRDSLVETTPEEYP